jgi:integrase
VWHPLGRNLPAALEEYGRRVQTASSPEHQLDPLMDAVFERLKKRTVDPWSPNTVKQYTLALAKLKHLLRNFSHPEQLKQKHAAQVKVLLGPTPNWANRVISLARLIFNDFVEHQVMDSNPFLGVKRHREAKRTRLLQWDEWWKVRTAAPRRLQLVMDGLYLTDQRIDDVLAIDERDALEQGIYFKQKKTGKELIVAWNDDLRRWWQECLELHGKVVHVDFQAKDKPRPLFRTRHSRRPGYKTVYDQWVRACSAAGVEDANLHDNRAFSATEARKQGLDPQKLLGHDDRKTTEIYLRDRIVEVVKGPTMRRILGA